MKKNKMALILIVVGAITACCLIGCNQNIASESSAVVHSWKGLTSQVSSDGGEGGFEFKADLNCAGCHENEAVSAEAGDCLYGIEDHADADCVECHEVTSELKRAHSSFSPGATMRGELRRTSVANQSCMTECHEDENLVALTASNTVLVDSEGTVVNPHEVMSIGTGHSEITCGSCHSWHSNESTEETAKALCISCHHENVYECGTCH
ncbi:hypothetical protein [Eggerthella sp. YY7918]|uniref:hypothetical protein n=1 Tax=Eggerthella sp. (strain YY7918) TaxID=502558 RepID=UPI00021715A7|nr:hypothetical protein [Eggerthella sp. YY7918]BAK45489.1 hypothetical protein EGYY_24200 [Eggerthella sp. YY7918]